MAVYLGSDHILLPVSSKNPVTLLRNAARLRALIAESRTDLVHAHSRAPAWSAELAARLAGIPFVTTFHGIYGSRGALKRAYNRVMVRGERVIAVSEYVAEHARTVYGCSLARIRVVHPGIDTAKFDPWAVPHDRKVALRSEWRVADDARIVLLPGRLTRLKGHRVLIEAMRALTDLNLVAVIVGSEAGQGAYRRELEASARDLPVRFSGHVDDMPTAYAASDIVVSASVRPESFGLVLAEAGAMGLPVVASGHGGANEIVRHGETGWLVAPADPAALANGIRVALAASGTDFAAGARAHIESHFTLDKMHAGTLAVYRELI